MNHGRPFRVAQCGSSGPTMTSMTSMTSMTPRSKCKIGWPAKLPIPFQRLGLGHVCLALFFLFGTASEMKNDPSCQECQKSPGTSESPGESHQESLVALRLFSPIRSTSPEALKAEVIAAEATLALRAEVDGLPVVYDSPGVSISLRKVSPDVLVTQGAILEAPDGGGVTIPADPRVRGRHGGPVTVSVTSYHAGDGINKEMPKIKFGSTRASPEVNTSNPSINETGTNGTNGTNGTTKTQIGNASEGVDRVDFFMTKTSVSWRGTVNVKVPGLSAQVPAKDRPWTPLGEDALYAEEKAEVKTELERLASLPSNEKLRGYRKLARQWHPDKHPPEEREKATEVFEYLQELRLALGLSHSQNSPQSSDSNSEIHSDSES